MKEFEPSSRNNRIYIEAKEYQETGRFGGKAKKRHYSAIKQNVSEGIKNITKGLAVATAGIVMVEASVALTDPAAFVRDIQEPIGSNPSPSSFTEIISATEQHVWSSEGVVIKESSCTETGTLRFYCKICDAVKDEDIPLLDHTDEITEAVEASCTDQGHTEIRVCSVCGEVLDAGEDIPALGHDWGPETTVNYASCTATGLRRIVCLRCGEKKDTIIAALGHNWSAETVLYEASCMEEGMKEKTCSRCGASARSSIAALGHDSGEEVLVSEATCTQDGRLELRCTRCGEVLGVSSSQALGHKESNGDYLCDVCGERLIDVVVGSGSHADGTIVANFHIWVTEPALFSEDIWVSVSCEDYLTGEVEQNAGSSDFKVYLYTDESNPAQEWYFTVTVFKGEGGAVQLMTKRFMIDDHYIVSDAD